MKIEIDIEDLRRLYDLATDSPLICSGSFETEDVRVLRRLGIKIGADLTAATPDEFSRDFPHEFKRATTDYLKMWIGRERRFETDNEVMVRLGELPTGCIEGTRSRPCNRDANHPIHQPDAPEPTSDPDDMIDDE